MARSHAWESLAPWVRDRLLEPQGFVLVNPSSVAPGTGIAVVQEAGVGGTFQGPELSCSHWGGWGLLTSSPCWGEAFIQTLPGTVNQLREEEDVRVKRGNREREKERERHARTQTRTLTHTDTVLEGQRKTY